MTFWIMVSFVSRHISDSMYAIDDVMNKPVLSKTLRGVSGNCREEQLLCVQACASQLSVEES